MSNRDKEIIKKMIKYCDDIKFLMAKYDSNLNTYKSDISFQYACNIVLSR